MICLGPVSGRTKHTEDDRPVSPTVTAVMEIRRLRVANSLMALMIVCTVVGMIGWLLLAWVVTEVERPERERRVRACAVAMEHEEYLQGPVEPCESLSPAERRSAAYEYGRMRGLW